MRNVTLLSEFLLIFRILVPFPANASEGGFPWDRVDGVEVDEVREELLRQAEELMAEVPCYGRCTGSVAVCLRKDPPHRTAARLARDVLMLLANGADRDEIMKWVDARKKMAHPDEIHSFDLDGLVPLGDKDAKVVIVEFSDFQCPFCAQVAPMLEKVVRASNGKARLYFKQFPIKSHPRSLEASKACVASQKFGKFWTYCAALFRHRDDLSDAALLKLAREAGIDPGKFAQEMQREEILSRIADEKMEGLRNHIQGTPTVYINGKEVLLQPTSMLMRDRVAEELDILHGRD